MTYSFEVETDAFSLQAACHANFQPHGEFHAADSGQIGAPRRFDALLRCGIAVSFAGAPILRGL